MQSIATVTTAPAETDLTTIERVKAELNMTSVDTARDNLLGYKIAEATSDIEAHLGRVLCRAGLTERFWGDPGCAEYLILARAPVASITSVTVDGVAVSSTEYRLDGASGILYRLDASGYPSIWEWCKDIVVVYVAGYIVPGESGRDLPEALEAATVELVASYWSSRGRDPTVKAEDVPGLGRVEYWVGAVGKAGELPPSVDAKIAPFRRSRL
jgi:uncharacterized phiE125 gp8 family phage protein